MANYMPQNVFNMCAVTAAQFLQSENTTIDEFANQISKEYRRHYIDDGFEEDILVAAHKVAHFLGSYFKDNQVGAGIRQLQYCLRKYHPSGKRKFFSRGTIFDRQRVPLPNRVIQCLTDVAVFHLGTLSGKFPLAPNDWHL
ncbi:MAG: hypothetical protein AAB433_00575 [Nitrospirota bacterium]